jgi:hypothetical protein
LFHFLFSRQGPQEIQKTDFSRQGRQKIQKQILAAKAAKNAKEFENETDRLKNNYHMPPLQHAHGLL